MGNKSIGQSFISASLKNARNLRKRFPENDDVFLPAVGNFQFKNLVFEISIVQNFHPNQKVSGWVLDCL